MMAFNSRETRSKMSTPCWCSAVPICTMLAPHKMCSTHHDRYKRRLFQYLDRWIQSLIERVDIGERSRFDVLAAYAAEAVFRADDNGFVFNIYAVADGVDTVDEF